MRGRHVVIRVVSGETARISKLVPIHGDVAISEGPGDEVLHGEDVVAHKPASANWTIASR
jgi:hypothetical protein